MPLNDSVGPRSIAFGGMIVNDVQDHLDSGIVKARHHFLEFGEGKVGHVMRSGGSGAKNAIVL